MAVGDTRAIPSGAVTSPDVLTGSPPVAMPTPPPSQTPQASDSDHLEHGAHPHQTGDVAAAPAPSPTAPGATAKKKEAEP